MIRSRPRKWNDESETIFHQHAGKIADHDLASMLNTDVKWIKRIREKFNIPKFTNRKYTDEQIEYIRQHYKTRSRREMIEELRRRYPDMTFTINGIEDRMRRYGMVRTKAESKAIRQREGQLGLCKERGKKAAEKLRIHDIGDIFWSNSYQQWMIVLPNYKWKFYKVYVWEQHNPKLLLSHYIRIKDPNKPIVIDNLEMVKKNGSNASTELSDNWIVSTMMHNKGAGYRQIYLNNPEIIEQQRLKIQAIRLIKALINENRTLGAPPKNDETPLLPG